MVQVHFRLRNSKFDEASENTLHSFLANFQFPISNFFDKDFNCIGATHILVFYDSDEPIRH